MADWTEQEIKQLKALWFEGYSMSAIAEAMGKSRNAIGGKVDRLGLEQHVARVRGKCSRVAPKFKRGKYAKTIARERPAQPELEAAEIVRKRKRYSPVERPKGYYRDMLAEAVRNTIAQGKGS